MRRIYDRYGDTLYCIRDDGTITDKWDVEVIGHMRSDRITDKWDTETLYRIRSDGTITDKWDVEVIGHICADGTITDKWDIDRKGSMDIPSSDSSAGYSSSSSYSSSSYSSYSGKAHGSYFPSDYGSWSQKKTVCLIITIAIQAALATALASGIVIKAADESLITFVIVNIVLLANSLISGILCKIAYYRIGSILSTVINGIIGAVVFVYAVTHMDGIITTLLAALFFGAIEYGVVYLGYLLSSQFCKERF